MAPILILGVPATKRSHRHVLQIASQKKIQTCEHRLRYFYLLTCLLTYLLTYGRCDEDDVDARWRPIVLMIHLHCDLFAVHCVASMIVVRMSTQSSPILSNHFFLGRPNGRVP